ncbi:MAG: hypothetical protein ACJA11_003283 [Glaciecola sp.]|jgi:hypothetical protein
MFKILFGGMLFLGLSIASAKGTESIPATYLLQVSSNFECREINIELVSHTGPVAQSLQFKDSAFALAELMPGTYRFGDLKCVSSNKGSDVFEISLSTLPPIELKSGQGYYGGKLIVKQTADRTVQGTPNVLENCPNVISKARGDNDDDCTDGVGVNTSPIETKTINVYAPVLATADLERVRKALQVSEEQLLYIPLISNTN